MGENGPPSTVSGPGTPSEPPESPGFQMSRGPSQAPQRPITTPSRLGEIQALLRSPGVALECQCYLEWAVGGGQWAATGAKMQEGGTLSSLALALDCAPDQRLPGPSAPYLPAPLSAPGLGPLPSKTWRPGPPALLPPPNICGMHSDRARRPRGQDTGRERCLRDQEVAARGDRGADRGSRGSGGMELRAELRQAESHPGGRGGGREVKLHPLGWGVGGVLLQV